jgi:hypothetical protein
MLRPSSSQPGNCLIESDKTKIQTNHTAKTGSRVDDLNMSRRLWNVDAVSGQRLPITPPSRAPLLTRFIQLIYVARTWDLALQPYNIRVAWQPGSIVPG